MVVRVGFLFLSLAIWLPGWSTVARAECSTPAEAAALDASLGAHLRCARLRLDRGSGIPCVAPALPACAGEHADAMLDFLAGAGVPEDPAGSGVRPQLRCQRALLGAARRYAGKRVRELTRGSRQARRGGVFASVRNACDRIPVVSVQGTSLPTLGDPCAGAVAASNGLLDGERVARCSRAVIERLSAAMSSGPLRPNVVLVLTDDQNLASVPWMERVTRFRQRAVNFANAFVTTPVCGPSRASLLSGRYAHRHGVISNLLAAPTFDSTSTVATWLQDAGYTTALIGKYMNFAGILESVPPGWDEWQALLLEEFGYNGFTDYAIDENGTHIEQGRAPRDYSTDLLAGRSLGFIRKNAGRPFLLVYAPFAPHLPAIPAARHEGYLRNIQPWRPANWCEPDVLLKPSWVRFMKSSSRPETVARIDGERIAQLESLLAVDEAFGRIEDTLETLGLADNTLLVFTSDHGYHWGEHWWSSKFTAYEESIRVPLAMRYPVLAPEPAKRSELVLNLDLAPTLAELAGASPPPGIDGTSLVPLFRGPGALRQDFLIENWGTIIAAPFQGVRDARFKYVKTAATAGVTEELYDLDADPGELVNLAFDPAWAATLAELRDRLVVLRDG